MGRDQMGVSERDKERKEGIAIPSLYILISPFTR